ncbi:hypothetical protein D3C78_1004510 [compost metagenome]
MGIRNNLFRQVEMVVEVVIRRRLVSVIIHDLMTAKYRHIWHLQQLILGCSEHPLPLLLQITVIHQISGADQEFRVAYIINCFPEGITPRLKVRLAGSL